MEPAPSPSPPAVSAGQAAQSRQAVATTLALVVCLVGGVVGVGRAHGAGALGEWLGALRPVIALVGGPVAAALSVAFLTARLGHRPQIPGAVAAGLAFALTLPPQTAAVPATIAMAFGWIVGREVFGKAERSFVHPAVLAHVFLAMTWPQALGSGSLWQPPEGQVEGSWSGLLLWQPPGGAFGATSGLACLLCALGLVALGHIPWRIVAAVPIGMAAGLGLLGGTATVGTGFTLGSHLVLGSVLFGVTFLATDPHASPSSSSARWAHGALIGFLVILLRLANPTSPDGTMSAILVASIFAPLLDYAANSGRSKWLRHEHG